jgi:hypothetical protein
MTRSRKERKARKQQLEQRAEAASPRRVKRKARRNKPLSAPPLRSPETFRELLREIREILFRRRTVYRYYCPNCDIYHDVIVEKRNANKKVVNKHEIGETDPVREVTYSQSETSSMRRRRTCRNCR